MNTRLTLFAVVALALSGSGCHDEEIHPGDYLPINSTTQHLLREQFSHPDLAYRSYADTIQISYGGETEMEGRHYHTFNFYSRPNGEALEHSDVYKFFRKEGTRYFEPHWNGEHMFLDTEMPEGKSWYYLDGFNGEVKTTYTIKSINQSRVINGITYRDVIDVEVITESLYSSDPERRLLSNARRYFARGFGEVYSLTRWYGYSGAMRLSITGH